MRCLSVEEIATLRQQGCWAEDWAAVSVAEDFCADTVHEVLFYGHVALGAMGMTVDCGGDMRRVSGVRHAVLRDVIVGDGCVIENIGCHISGYTIGAGSVIMNVGTMEAFPDGSYGVGSRIAVLTEEGAGSIVLSPSLNAPIASLLLHSGSEETLRVALQQLLLTESANMAHEGSIGCGCRVVNCGRLTNVVLGDGGEIDGALLVEDSTVCSSMARSVYIGAGVCVSGSVIAGGASLLRGVSVDSCFVGRDCCLRDGFAAVSSLFFEGCELSAGEATASFCGPYTVSKHRSSLLVAAALSFFNAGAGTVFSNHAYKMGPVHSGLLARGCKTAVHTSLAFPATIGAFSVCTGRIDRHADTRCLPFSYLFGANGEITIKPGRSLVSAGLWRDIHKWERRGRRLSAHDMGLVTFDWLNPYVVESIVEGCRLLARLRADGPTDDGIYHYAWCSLSSAALDKGLTYYDMALHLFMGMALAQHTDTAPTTAVGATAWTDMGGLLLPLEEEENIVSAVVNGEITSATLLTAALHAAATGYDTYRWTYAYHFILKYYKVDTLTPTVREQILDDYAMARHDWLSALRRDAEREYALGDVSDETLHAFLASLDDDEG